MTAPTRERVEGGVGESVARPDGVPKLTGNFAYVSDLYADNMLWGATRRSPHAHARMLRLDVTPALAMAGVRSVLTQEDVPGEPRFGQHHRDQPVLCDGVARYWGEPVAIVAADDPETDCPQEPRPADHLRIAVELKGPGQYMVHLTATGADGTFTATRCYTVVAVTESDVLLVGPVLDDHDADADGWTGTETCRERDLVVAVDGDVSRERRVAATDA